MYLFWYNNVIYYVNVASFTVFVQTVHEHNGRKGLQPIPAEMRKIAEEDRDLPDAPNVADKELLRCIVAADQKSNGRNFTPTSLKRQRGQRGTPLLQERDANRVAVVIRMIERLIHYKATQGRFNFLVHEMMHSLQDQELVCSVRKFISNNTDHAYKLLVREGSIAGEAYENE